MGQAVEETGAIEIAEAVHPRRVGLRFQVAPFCQLRQGGRDLLDPRHAIHPPRLGQHLVGAQLQPVLPLGCREHVHDGAVKAGLVGAHMPE